MLLSDTHIYVCMYVWIYTYAYTHTHTHTHTQTHTHTHADHLGRDVLARANLCALEHLATLVETPTRTKIAQLVASGNKDTAFFILMKQIHANAHTHTQIYTHTHTYTHTHKATLTCPLQSSRTFSGLMSRCA
jgi:hypothetical protein